jgi:hypothetical protein
MAFFTREEIARSQGKQVITHSIACPNCKSTRFIVEAGRGPHCRHLRCVECGRGGMWLSKTEARFR